MTHYLVSWTQADPREPPNVLTSRDQIVQARHTQDAIALVRSAYPNATTVVAKVIRSEYPKEPA